MPENPSKQEYSEPPLEVISCSALEQITRGEIDMQISTAKRYPRSISKFKAKAMEMATLDEETAESCFYNLPRDGKEIQGPSARLAEIVASAWTNTRSGARVIANDGKSITAQGFCHDLETNTFIAVEVKRRITTKAGKTFSEDMQVVTGNAGCSIALRNAVFKVIPMAYVRSIYEAAKKVAIGDATTLVARRAKAIDYFAKMGVKQDRVLSVLGRAKMDDVTLEDIETLTGLKTAIKSGDTTVDEAFPEPEVKANLDAPKPGNGSDKKTEPAKASPAPKAPLPEDSPGPLHALKAKLHDAGFTEADFFHWAHGIDDMAFRIDHKITSLDEWDELLGEVDHYLAAWPIVEAQIKKVKAEPAPVFKSGTAYKEKTLV